MSVAKLKRSSLEEGGEEEEEEEEEDPSHANLARRDARLVSVRAQVPAIWRCSVWQKVGALSGPGW